MFQSENTYPKFYLYNRIVKAKDYLENEFTVSDTCFKIGFDSLTSFTGLFKKHEGLTPSAYQQWYRQRQEKMKTQPLGFIPHCFATQKGWTENSNFQEVL